jgi:hypothetical protein
MNVDQQIIILKRETGKVSQSSGFNPIKSAVDKSPSRLGLAKV